MAPRSSGVASLSFFCLLLLLLLLPALHVHGASSHAITSYKLGPRQILFNKTTGKSSGNSQQASTTVPTPTSCSSLATTGLGSNKLPVMHRQSPCFPLHGLPSLTVADDLHRDASVLRHRFSSQSAASAAPSPAGTIIPVNGSSVPPLAPGALAYSVLVSYGTPEQQFPVFLDAMYRGTSRLRCKPCASGSSDDCDPAFDTSRSSTFAHILCGSPDCPPTANCSGGASSFCSLDERYWGVGTFAKDVLTLAPSMAPIHDFRFFCLDMGLPFYSQSAAGTLDLGRGRNSLPSQLWSSSPTANFSYCLPQSPSSMQGFLSLGGDTTVVGADNNNNNNNTVYAPLVSNNDGDDWEVENQYFIDLVGMSLGDEDLSIPAGTLAKNGTVLDVGATFTMLTPDAYTALRDSFQKQMSQYSNLSSPARIHGFDTCFNFTGLNELVVPLVQLNFSNGDSLVVEGQQMLYYDDPEAAPFTMACLAFSSLYPGIALSAMIGTYTLASTEVVYDVAGGKVGFIPGRCY